MTGRVGVSPDKRGFVRDGRRFFYAADTVWSAFTHMSDEAWSLYLRRRAAQGYNALQIILLPPVHDFSEPVNGLFPFERNAGGNFDFGRRNERYFERAHQMLLSARALGFTPVLAPLWVNYAPDSWAAGRTPGNQLPDGMLEDYIGFVGQRFRDCAPMYFASGDTRFESEREIDCYARVLRALKKADPESLAALHTAPGAQIPRTLLNMPELDFYAYQSGHDPRQPDNAYEFAKAHYALSPIRPAINAEPCYEGCGHAFAYGRFGPADVRRAVWHSLLGGASAGAAYGAHGVWCWHRQGRPFAGESFSAEPFDAMDALRLPGAWDLPYAARLLALSGIEGLRPSDEILRERGRGVAAEATDGSAFVVYSDCNWVLDFQADLSRYELSGYLLDTRRFAVPMVEHNKIWMFPENSDYLIVAHKKA